MRYVVAFNWCQAVVTLVTVVLILGWTAAGGGPNAISLQLLIGIFAVVIYWMVLCWYMAWRGLGVGKLKAVLAVIVINMGTGVLVMGPQLLLGVMAGRAVAP